MSDPYREEEEAMFHASVLPMAQLLYDLADDLSRKRRTLQHMIADLSVHGMEAFILEAGHTALRLSSDYGYDL